MQKMGWSSGTFTRTNGTYTGASVWASDEAATIDIESARHDTHDQDLAAGINSTLHKGGQNSPTADLPMGGFKHTNVANATARSNYGVVGQIQDGNYSFGGLATGAANVYAVSVTPAITAYAEGQCFQFEAHQTNTTTTPTLNINSVGATTMKRLDESALYPGDIVSGVRYWALYDDSAFLIINPSLGWTTYTPTYGASGSMTYTSVTTSIARYTLNPFNKVCTVRLYFNGTTGGTASNQITVSLPFTSRNDSFGQFYWAYVEEAGAIFSGKLQVQNNSSTALLSKADSTNFGLGTLRYGIIYFEYEVA
jgi:hypothetical protein